MTENQPSPIRYVVRNVDPALWAAVKQRTAEEGRSIRFVIISALRVYAASGFQFIEDGRRRPGA